MNKILLYGLILAMALVGCAQNPDVPAQSSSTKQATDKDNVAKAPSEVDSTRQNRDTSTDLKNDDRPEEVEEVNKSNLNK